MKRLRTVFLAAAMVLTGGQGSGAEEGGNRVLEDLRTRFADVRLLCADFEQSRHLEALSRPLVSRGNMVFKKSAGVVWRVTDPFPGRALVTHSEIVRWDGDGPPRRLTLDRSPLFRAITGVVLSLFAGDMAALERDFAVTPTAVGAGRWRLTLAPKAAEVAKAVTEIEVTGREFVESLAVMEARGDRTEIRFAALRTAGCALDATEQSYFKD